MKRVLVFAALFSFVCLFGQNMSNVYNRYTGQEFKLKSVRTTSVIYGSIVKHKTVFTYENPFKKLTEASVNFSLMPGAALSGFGYWYADEFVRGILMDKDQAWFIYTAITSRNRDPGIMEQVSPESYHAQIYPLAAGYDLRVELTAVEFLEHYNGDWVVSKPAVPDGIPFEQYVSSANPYVQLSSREGHYVVHRPSTEKLDVFLTAQRFRDGRVYVCGIAEGQEGHTSVDGLNELYFTGNHESGSVTSFAGWLSSPSIISVTRGSERTNVPVYVVTMGDETAKLWAQQKLANEQWKSKEDVLRLSFKYGIPSRFTALLAVPKSEMKLFEQKKREFLSQLRKDKLEAKRQDRAWKGRRNVSSNRSSGGDPEIRISIPDAQAVYAVLPDGRTINLVPTGEGYWGGNFEIPADSPEGDYTIRVYSMNKDGSTTIQQIVYTVDRTPPVGTASVVRMFGNAMLVVRSEVKLAKVFAVALDGAVIELKETSPGIYMAVLPNDAGGELRITMLDGAHNRGEILCRY